MKKMFNIVAAVGFAIAIWSCGENDGSVFTAGETFAIGLAGLGMLGAGLALSKLEGKK